MESGELNLLDLPRIQTELERILAATSQRMTCILRHLHGEPIPTPVLRNLGLMEPDPDNQPQHPLETARKKIASSEESSSSLVVSTNPDKPLSLIITSNKKDQQQPSNAENLDTSLEDKGKVKGVSESYHSSEMLFYSELDLSKLANATQLHFHMVFFFCLLRYTLDGWS